VGNNLIESPGKMRIYDVTMGGTNWRPELPTKEKINNLIDELNENKEITDSILTFMCKLMKMQFFNDGNKRTSMLVANHELIKNGRGIISVAEENKIDFGEKLIRYYEDENNLDSLKQFIYDNCLYGIEI
jgi:prophage maintenance system killer protein